MGSESYEGTSLSRKGRMLLVQWPNIKNHPQVQMNFLYLRFNELQNHRMGHIREVHSDQIHTPCSGRVVPEHMERVVLEHMAQECVQMLLEYCPDSTTSLGNLSQCWGTAQGKGSSSCSGGTS